MRFHHLLFACLPAVVLLVSGCGTSPHPSGGADGREATKILKRWVAASGGQRAFRKIESVECEGVMDFGPLVPDVGLRSWAMTGGRFRYEMNTPAYGELVTACDGKTAWQENAKLGFGMLAPRQKAEMMRESDPREEINIDRYYPFRHRLTDVSINGQPLQVVGLTTPEGGTEKWFMDPDTGLRVRVEKDGGVTEYSDFRKVGAFTFPFVDKHSGKDGAMTVRLTKLVINPKVDPAVFSPTDRQMQDAATVEHILGRYYEAAGGSRIAEIKTRVSHVIMDMPKVGVKAEMTITQKRPNFVLIDQTVPGMGRTVQGYDGKTGWANSDMQGYRVLKGAELQQLLNNSDLDAEAKVRTTCPLRTLLGERMIDGHRTQAVCLGSLKGSNGTYYFDEDSGHLVRVETSIIAGPGSVIQATMDVSDFREVDGVVMPFRTVMDNPAVHLVLTVGAVEQNVPVDDAIFKPRQED